MRRNCAVRVRYVFCTMPNGGPARALLARNIQLPWSAHSCLDLPEFNRDTTIIFNWDACIITSQACMGTRCLRYVTCMHDYVTCMHGYTLPEIRYMHAWVSQTKLFIGRMVDCRRFSCVSVGYSRWCFKSVVLIVITIDLILSINLKRCLLEILS